MQKIKKKILKATQKTSKNFKKFLNHPKNLQNQLKFLHEK